MNGLEQKEARLRAILSEMGSVLVAYSGGVDSAYLAVAAHDALGARALAVTAVSPSLAPGELEEAVVLARQFGFRHRLAETLEVEDPRYAANDARRCYFCKEVVYSRLRAVAEAEGLAWTAAGTNADDLKDFRPGLSAGRELGVRDPLLEAGLTKAEVRELSRRRGLPTWDKPAQPCLSSRIPYGSPVTVEALVRIARAEAYLKGLGFREVRVRHHGSVARIEVAAPEIPRLVAGDLREAVLEHLKGLGYLHVAVDLGGYRMGGLNAALRGRRPSSAGGVESGAPPLRAARRPHPPGQGHGGGGEP